MANSHASLSRRGDSKWEVRWREGGRHRSKMFKHKCLAADFKHDLELRLHATVTLVKNPSRILVAGDQFKLLNAAWETHRPIAFLLGSGVAAGSRQPSSTRRAKYLNAVKKQARTTHDNEGNVSSLLERLECDGWPSPSALNYSLCDSPLPTSRDAIRQVLKGEDESYAPNEQREKLLASLLKRELNATFPCPAMSYLTAILKLTKAHRVVLTTMLGHSIEAECANSGMTCYSGSVADDGLMPELARSYDVNVIHLHGDTYAQQVLTSIDAIPDPQMVDKFLEYLSPDALLVVLGYSANDIRIPHLVTQFARNSHHEESVLWAYRSRLPYKHRALFDEPSVVFTRTKGADRFLRELLLTIHGAFPPSIRPYKAVLSHPPEPFTPESETISDALPSYEPTRPRVTAGQVVVLASDHECSGTSKAMSERISVLETGYDHVIWIDLEDVPSVAALSAVLSEELNRIDATFTPALVHASRHFDDTSGFERHLERISAALVRNGVILAFSAVAAFGRQPPGSTSTQLDDEKERLWLFLKKLLGNIKGEPNSCVYLAHSGQSILLDQLRDECGANIETVEPTSGSTMERLDRNAIVEVTGFAAYTKDYNELWKHLSFRYQLLLGLSAFLRTPRINFQLTCLAETILNNVESIDDFCEYASTGLTKPQFDEFDLRCADERTLFSLQQLSRTGLLVYQEGGTYRMFRDIRNKTFDNITNQFTVWASAAHSSSTPADNIIANVHHLISMSYAELLFRPTRDLSAFFEYVYHAIESCKHSDGRIALQRIESLGDMLDESRYDLLARGYAAVLIDWIQQLRHYAKSLSNQEAERPRVIKLFQRSLCDLEAIVRREATDFVGAAVLRLRQLVHRLRESGNRNNILKRGMFLSEFAEICDKLESDRLTEHCREWLFRDDWAKELSHELKSISQSLAKALHHSNNLTQEQMRLLFRAWDHILEVAVCYKGIRDYDTSCSILSSLYQCLAPLTDEVPQSLRGHLLRLRAKCCYRSMDAELQRIRPWLYQSNTTGVILDRALRWHSEATELQRRYGRLKIETHSPKDTFGALFHCYILNLKARYHALKAASMPKSGSLQADQLIEREFELAAKTSEKAVVAVKAVADSEFGAATAVCRLYRVELLILQSDFYLALKDKKGGAVSSLQGIRVLGLQLLDNAAAELSAAEATLSTSRRNIWWWTLLHSLKAQQIHERVIAELGSEAGRCDRPGLVRTALDAIGAGVDNADSERLMYFKTLWQQFFLITMAIEWANGKPNNSAMKYWHIMADGALRHTPAIIAESQLLDLQEKAVEWLERHCLARNETIDREMLLKLEDQLIRRPNVEIMNATVRDAFHDTE